MFHITNTWQCFTLQTLDNVQPIAIGVSFNFNLQSQSHRSLLNGTWQKRPRELERWLRFENDAMKRPNAIGCITSQALENVEHYRYPSVIQHTVAHAAKRSRLDFHPFSNNSHMRWLPCARGSKRSEWFVTVLRISRSSYDDMAVDYIIFNTLWEKSVSKII